MTLGPPILTCELQRIANRLLRNQQELEVELTPAQAGEFYASCQLLTDPQLAKLLGVHLQTLRRWRYYALGPPAVYLGHRVRYIRADVERWLKTLRSAHTKVRADSKNHEATIQGENTNASTEPAL